MITLGRADLLGMVLWWDPAAFWAFCVAAVLFGGLGILIGQHIAWWFLFPRYRSQWQSKRQDRRGRWS